MDFIGGNQAEMADVLDSEIQSAIDDIKSANTAKCEAHGPMARGLIVLLRCQQARIRTEKQTVAVAGVTGAGVAGLIMGAVQAVNWWRGAP